MGINVASSFTRNAPVPIDDALVVADLTARDAILDGVRYEGMFCYVVAEGKNYQLVGGITDSDWVEFGTVSGGGGGSGTLTGYAVDDYLHPEEVTVQGVQFLRFDYLDQKSRFYKIKVPSSYEAGQQIYLSDGVFKVNSTDNTKDILFSADTYLVKKTGATMAALAGTPHTSTNTEVAPGATANYGLAIGDLDLTEADGEVNGVAVAAGDILIVRIYRNFAAETASFQGDADLVRDDFNLSIVTP